MESSVIAQEFQRFFSLFFSGKQFACFLLGDNGEKFIRKNTVTPLQPEQKIWLSRLDFDPSETAIIPQGHQLHLRSEGNCYLFRSRVKNFTLFTLATQADSTAGDYIRNIVPELLHQLEQRFAAAQLLGRLQSKIAELETEKSLNAKAQLQVLLNKVDQWKAKLPHSVSIDNSIFSVPANLQQPDDLLERLSRCYDLQCFLQPGAGSITITSEMLPETGLRTPEPARLSSWTRASLLLDKYEEAAENVLQSGLAINGKTIAQFLVPSISPPAITDALKKNRKGIHHLLQEYPAKWPLLRQNLKQVRELHENSALFMPG